VGIPKGRFSSVPGFGIQILRVGFDFRFNFRHLTSFRHASGDSTFLPSTPAVFLLVLCWVTLRTAKHLQDQDLIKAFWSRLTVLTVQVVMPILNRGSNIHTLQNYYSYFDK